MERDTFSLLEAIVKGYEKDQKHSNFKKELLDLSIGNPDLTPDIKWIKRLQYFINQNDRACCKKFLVTQYIHMILKDE